jgi:hypothetical protein
LSRTFIPCARSYCAEVTCLYGSLIWSSARATAKKTLKKQEEADKAKLNKSNSANSAATDDDDQIEAELGMAPELEAKHKRKAAEIAEIEIVGRGLLSIFGPSH